MLDIGWQEFVLVGFVLLIVVGPQELPKVLKTIVNSIRKIKSMAYDFQNSVDEMANQAEISELNLTRTISIDNIETSALFTMTPSCSL